MKARFSSEAALCEAFISALPPDWTAYAETAGWDILVVRRDGTQVGIQAKLVANIGVLAQAMARTQSWSLDEPGPDYRAILVPAGPNGAARLVGSHLGITVVEVRDGGGSDKIRPRLDGLDDEAWFDMMPTRRHDLPEYVPDVVAGRPAPVQLTAWKIAALRVIATLEVRGFVTRRDFRAHRINYGRWIAAGAGWLRRDEARPGAWVAGARLPNFAEQHPVVYAQIKSEIAGAA